MSPSLPRILFRGLRRRCPQCGIGRLFDGFFAARPRCDSCGLDLTDPHGDNFGLFYLTTGAITGVGIVVLLLVRPKNVAGARLILGAVVALIYGGTIPMRRGFALAAGYAIKRASGEI